MAASSSRRRAARRLLPALLRPSRPPGAGRPRSRRPPTAAGRACGPAPGGRTLPARTWPAGRPR
eukprot:14982213-Alexandrium_andersonii.AAC.1